MLNAHRQLTEAAFERLLEIATPAEVDNVATVLANAIDLYELLVRRRAEGDAVVLRNAEGIERELTLL